MRYTKVKEGDLAYHTIVSLQQKVKHLEQENEKLRNGEALRKESESKDRWRRKYEKEHAARLKEQRQAEAVQEKEIRRQTKIWKQAAEDSWADQQHAQRAAAKYKAENKELREKIKDLEQQLQSAQAHIKKLNHRLGQTSKNSSIPSSQNPVGTNVTHQRNHRQVSGKKPGAQDGHDHYPRKKIPPTEPPVYIEERPEKTIGDDKWHRTDRYEEKLFVGIQLKIPVIPVRAWVWEHEETGETCTASYPFGMKDEINYLPELRAFAFCLTQNLNVSGRKVQAFLKEAGNGILEVSNGWIAQLSKEFSEKSQEEVNAIYAQLFEEPVLGVDSTVTKNNGKRECISVCRTEELAFFAHTERKGSDAAAALPCAPGSGYEGCIVSDREAAMLKMGTSNQQCLIHHSRDLMGIREMEPHLTWHRDFQDLLLEMMADRHDWGPEGPEPEKVQEWNQRYDDILERGRLEYIKYPPSAEYLKGHNLRDHFVRTKESMLLFLKDVRVPPDNNGSERDIRGHKRALHAKVTFRSGKYIDAHCQFMTIAVTSLKQGNPLLPALRQIFEKAKACKKPGRKHGPLKSKSPSDDMSGIGDS